MTPDLANKTKEAFSFFKDSHYRNVPGIFCVEGPEPGRTVGVTFCTHGNEPSGLVAAYDFVQYIKKCGGVDAGRVILVLNNLAATERFFASKTPEEKSHSRYIDIDMNRLPEKTLELTNDTRSEIIRARELAPVWEEFEFALDTHTTTLKTTPFIVSIGKTFPKELIHKMPISQIISNIDAVQSNHPAAHFYGSKQKPASSLGIECGSHNDYDAFACATESLFMFLNNTGVIQRDGDNFVNEYLEYEMVQAISFPDLSYKLIRLFENFETVEKGQVLAKGRGPDITADYAGHAFFVARSEAKNTHDEMLFLSKPVVTRKL